MKKYLSIVFVICAYFCSAFAATELSVYEENAQVEEYFFTSRPSIELMGEPVVFDARRDEFRPNPRRAVWLAAAFPGLGQIYNRKFWKLPIVYGVFTGLTYGIVWNNQYFNDYRNAYRGFSLWQLDNSRPTDDFIGMLPAGSSLETINQAAFSNTLRLRRDLYRRNRDLCIISIVGFYALTILDAFVDAQLFDFHISPDLSMNVSPMIQLHSPRSTAAFGLQYSLNF